MKEIIIIVITAILAPLILELIKYTTTRRSKIDDLQLKLKEKARDVRLQESEVFSTLIRAIQDIQTKNFSSKSSQQASPFRTTVGRDLLRIKYCVSYEHISRWINNNSENIGFIIQPSKKNKQIQLPVASRFDSFLPKSMFQKNFVNFSSITTYFLL